MPITSIYIPITSTLHADCQYRNANYQYPSRAWRVIEAGGRAGGTHGGDRGLVFPALRLDDPNVVRRERLPVHRNTTDPKGVQTNAAPTLAQRPNEAVLRVAAG